MKYYDNCWYIISFCFIHFNQHLQTIKVLYISYYSVINIKYKNTTIIDIRQYLSIRILTNQKQRIESHRWLTHRCVQQLLDALLRRPAVLGPAQHVHPARSDAQTLLQKQRAEKSSGAGEQHALAVHETRDRWVVLLAIVEHVLGADVNAARHSAVHQARIAELQNHVCAVCWPSVLEGMAVWYGRLVDVDVVVRERIGDVADSAKSNSTH